ncbi:MAG: hypothetical protein HRU23_08240 [Gammaproteobacteria bacterium]|nr:hypothetical protein [Gammaproteobacteria bacterium]
MSKFVALICLLCSFFVKAQTFVINSAVIESHQTPKSKYAQLMLKEAFHSLNIDVEFRYRPDKRSIVETNNGHADGEFARIATIVDDYPNLVVVPESLAQMDIVAFTAQPSINLAGYKIEQHNYSIGYLSGWKNLTDILVNYPNKKAIGEYKTLFRLLARQRIDVLLFTKNAGEQILDAMAPLPYQRSPVLFTYPVYLVIHKKHVDLVPQLATSLRRLKLKYSTNR